MSASTLSDAGTALLGSLAGLLADDALPDALGLLVRAGGLRSAVLRSADGDLLGVAGEVVHAVPARRGPTPLGAGPSVTLPVRGAGGRELAALTVVGARPSQLPGLRAAAAVLGLALSPDAVAPAADLLLGTESERDALADGLHDGPVQSLVAARYAADAAVRGGSATAARDAVQDALVTLRRTLWHLRPRGAEGLPAALQALSGRLEEAGQEPLQLAVDAGAADALAPAAALTVYRLVQAVALTSAGAAQPVRVAVRTGPAAVLVDVESPGPLAHPERWRDRLRALGGDLSSSAGRLRLVLPAPTPTPPAPSETKACS